MMKKTIEKAVHLPQRTSVEIKGNTVAIKTGEKKATKSFKANGISFKQEDNKVTVIGKPASRKMNALVNTISSHINNLVTGLKTEYVYKMAIVYSHFPMTVTVKGNLVEINNSRVSFDNLGFFQFLQSLQKSIWVYFQFSG